ncbi:hypothetical protein BH739_04695 [Enterococcus casseliflavus]|nr:hypothetical protein BH739_04695 [Enterococcus casseliflavus]
MDSAKDWGLLFLIVSVILWIYITMFKILWFGVKCIFLSVYWLIVGMIRLFKLIRSRRVGIIR